MVVTQLCLTTRFWSFLGRKLVIRAGEIREVPSHEMLVCSVFIGQTEVLGLRRIELMRDEVDLGVDTVTEKAGNRKREVELHLKL